MSKDNKELVSVIVKRVDRKGFIQFLQAVEDKINEGYEMVREGQYAPRCHPKAAWFKKKGEGVVEAESAEATEEEDSGVVPKEVSLEDLKGKKELLAFAADKGIEIPEEAKAPLAIKKVIKEVLENK